MSDNEKTGLNSALVAALDQFGDAPPDVKGEQLALLPLPLDDDDLADVGELADREERRRGRPKGAKNRRTEAWQQWLLSSYRSPLEMLCETYCMPATRLAEILGCSLLEAFKLQIMAAKEAGPYLHQKMPVAVDITGAPPVHLTIHNAAPAAPLEAPRQGDGAVLITGKILGIESEDKSDT